MIDVNKILSGLVQNPQTAQGLSQLLQSFQQQRVQGRGSGAAMDLSSYQNPYQVMQMALGGVPGKAGKKGGDKVDLKNCGKPGQPPCPEFGKQNDFENWHDTYWPVLERIEKVTGKDLDSLVGDKTITTPARRVLAHTLGYGRLNDEPQTVPPPNPTIQEIHKKIGELPDDEIRKLLTQDYSKIGLFNFGNYLPSNVGVLDALRYTKEFKRLRDEGYSFPYGGIVPRYANGGRVPQAGLGKFLGKVGKGIWGQIKGAGDMTMSMLGAPDLIKDTYVDKSKFFTGLSKGLGAVVQTGLNTVLPGSGTALGAFGSAINPSEEQDLSGFNGGFTGGGMGQPSGMEGLMSLLQGFGNGGDALNFGGEFQSGGVTQPTPEGLTAIQTEKYKGLKEKIVLPDGMIVDVNAEKAHEKMKDDEVTDLVPEGSLIVSARPGMKLKRKDFEDIEFGYETLPYSEYRKGVVPKMTTAADIISSKKKNILPAEYAEIIKKKFEVIDPEDEDNPFVRQANTENMAARQPYLSSLFSLSEAKRMSLEPAGNFRNGGVVPKFDKGKIVKGNTKATGIKGDVAGLSNLAPLLGGLISGTAGSANVASQRRQMQETLAQLSGLRNNLMGLNNQGIAAGIMGQLAQETDLPELKLDYRRLENLNTSTPESFIEGAARPTVDMTAALDRLGSREGAGMLGNLQSQQMQQRNAAAQSAFNSKRSMDYNIANAVTEGKNRETMANNNIQQQQIAARNNVFNNIAGQIQGGIQNKGNILSNYFTNRSQLDLQKSMLRGQAGANWGNILTSMGGVGQQVDTNTDAVTNGANWIGGLFKGAGNTRPAGNTMGMSHTDIKGLFPSNIPQPSTRLNTPLPSGLNANSPYFNPYFGLNNFSG